MPFPQNGDEPFFRGRFRIAVRTQRTVTLCCSVSVSSFFGMLVVITARHGPDPGAIVYFLRGLHSLLAVVASWKRSRVQRGRWVNSLVLGWVGGDGVRGMSRVMCYKCNRPEALCWCGRIVPMATRTKFVILMHPYEHRQIKLNTGRLTHFCLADSELYVGERFDENEAVQALIDDPANYPVLLYPGKEARDLSKGELRSNDFAGRRLVVFLLDGTWRHVGPMLRFSLSLQRLPKVMFSKAAPSRYVIKRQPEAGCLSTLEATHELLLALDRNGLDEYSMPEQMLDLFMEMQAFQVRCEVENRRPDFVPRKNRGKVAGSLNPSKRRRVFMKGEG